MKLSHRDFRPEGRSKYVSKPPVRWPTLRIFLIAAFGAVIYLKFDTIASLRIVQAIVHPQALFQVKRAPETNASPTANTNAVFQWSTDSGEVDLTCTTNTIAACLQAGGPLDSGSLGSLRGLVQKVAMQWDLTPTAGFSAHFQKSVVDDQGTEKFRLRRLEFSSQKGPLVLAAQDIGTTTRFCSPSQCLDKTVPRPPFPKFQSLDRQSEKPPELEMKPLEGKVFHPILDGRIVEVQTESQWVKVYHGRNTFSSYGGFSRLRPNLRPGSLVNTQDTLGFMEAGGDSLGRLHLRIEKNGLFVSPLAFLGLAAESEMGDHGP